MGRPLRAGACDMIYHVWNRANGRQSMFEKVEDYEVFDRTFIAAHERVAMRTLAYCVARGQPYGTEGWVKRMIRRMNLEGTVRPRGRPRKRENGS